MSPPIPDMASSSSAMITDSGQGRGGQAGRGRRGGRGGRGGRENQNGGHGKKVFNNSRRPKFRGSFQAMRGHVFELPEESNDQMQYSMTIDMLKEHIKTAYKETYMEIVSLFNNPMTQPTAR